MKCFLKKNMTMTKHLLQVDLFKQLLLSDHQSLNLASQLSIALKCGPHFLDNPVLKPVLLFWKRYGFVEFDDPRDADDAVYDLNGKELCGERVIVEHTKGPRRDGGYGGRSKCPVEYFFPHA